MSLVALAVVATLAGHTSLTAIAQFGRLRGHKFGHPLGFRSGHRPCANTFANLFAALDADHLDRLLGDWLGDRHPNGHDHLALDGKVVRGSRDADTPGLHLLAADASGASAVVAPMTVAATPNEHKAALRLLGVLPQAGAVVTADAMFTHPDVAERILDSGGDYVRYAKDNQRQLRADLEAAFTAAGAGTFPPAVQADWQADVRTATTRSKGHGRTERRTLTTSTWLGEYLTAWPGVAQVFRLVRERTAQGKTTVEVVYGVTSLGRVVGDAERLLELIHDPADAVYSVVGRIPAR